MYMINKQQDHLVHIDIIWKWNRFWWLAKRIINSNTEVILSDHSQMEIWNEIKKGFLWRWGKEQVIETIKKYLNHINENDIFEIWFFIWSSNKLIITKICFRIKKFTDTEDLIVVLWLNKWFYKIRTVWLNHMDDKHTTLDRSKYVSLSDFNSMY